MYVYVCVCVCMCVYICMCVCLCIFIYLLLFCMLHYYGVILKCLCKIFTKFAAKFHTHTHCSSSSFIVTLSLIQQTACACAQFSACSWTINVRSEKVQMTVCCQNLMLGALSRRSVFSVLVRTI